MKQTNLQKVVEFVKAGQSKNEVIDRIVNELGKSRSNAFVYFTKASKLVGGDVVKAVKSKAVKPNSSEAFIQRVLEERKEKKASPFEALGV